MRRIFAIIGLSILTLLPTNILLAYESNICSNATCTTEEVGIVMVGITDDCGNAGNCQLTDIMTVFANIGNWISGIIGAIVLMMYVIGGFFFLISGGNQERVKKGKEYIRISTIGMFIVMFAYLGIFGLRGVIEFGSADAYGDGEYIACVNEETEGATCNLNSTCVDGACRSECYQQYGEKVVFGDTTVTYYDCVDTTEGSDDIDEELMTILSCIPNLCPGDEHRKCCQIEITVEE